MTKARDIDGEEFVSMCKQLRELGAVKVVAGDFFAQWAAVGRVEIGPTVQPGPVVARVQFGPKREPKKEEPLTVHDGEHLSEEDKERRRKYRETIAAVAGES